MYLYSSFLIKLHSFPFLLLIYFALNSSVPGVYFSFKKKFNSFLSPKDFSVRSFKESSDFGTSSTAENVETIILWENDLRARRVDFAAFSRALRNWWEKPCISRVVKYTSDSDERKVSILYRKKWVSISQALPVWWISLHFPMLWGIDGETHALHIL